MKKKPHDPHESVDFIYRKATEYAQAKANRVHIEEYRKSKKALLMKACKETAVNAQEREAYSNSEYIELLDGLKEAVEKEETLRWQIEAARLRVDIWRTEEASNRAIDRAAA